MNTVENNYLIADFMELNLGGVSKKGHVAHAIQEGEHEGKTFLTDAELAKYLRSLSEDDSPELSDDFLVEEAHSQGYVDHVACPPYHSSWDWLMSVVEKIEEDERFDVRILQYGTIITLDIQLEIVNNVADISFDKKIEHTYSAVVEFIKWYNENK